MVLFVGGKGVHSFPHQSWCVTLCCRRGQNLPAFQTGAKYREFCVWNKLCWTDCQGWRLEQGLLLGKVSPGCSFASAGPLKSHPSWSFNMVITDMASSSHLILKLMGLFTVGFPFSFVLRMPAPFWKNKNSPWVFHLLLKLQDLHLKSFFKKLLVVWTSPDSLNLHPGVLLHWICSSEQRWVSSCKMRQLAEKGVFGESLSNQQNKPMAGQDTIAIINKCLVQNQILRKFPSYQWGWTHCCMSGFHI